jgi:Flp pilus assembly protein TadG
MKNPIDRLATWLSWPRQARRKGQRGQAIVMMALMLMFVLAGGVGISVDALIGYVTSLSVERAAAAGALAGVVYMPNQYNSPPTNNATAKAIAAAMQNGYDPADTAHGVVVDPERVQIPASNPPAYYANKLQVTVSRQVQVYFMQLLGFNSYQVSRTAVATYLPPINLGQPGGQIGSTTAQLGSNNNYYFMRTEGWNVDRVQGDAFTPNPAYENGGPLNPPSTDVHQISASQGSEPSDPTLPDRGGYNYLITIPASGGYIQIYNAAFGPDGGPNGSSGPHNHCDNTQGWTICSSGGNYYLHEEDSVSDFTNKELFTAMRYTLYQVQNQFIRSNDVKLTQTTVYPIDATNWNANPPRYKNVNTGATITQTYDGAGNPSNMSIYHSWMDVATYTGANDGGLVVLNQYGNPGSYITGGMLVGGTYRLRVDSLQHDGDVSTSSSQNVAHKAYAVRVLDSTRNLCTTNCSMAAWNDMSWYTPVNSNSFTVPLFQLPPYYAGKTVTVDIWDPGDIQGAGNVYIDLIDPATNNIATSAAGVNIYDLGVQRSNAGTLVSAPGNTQASILATSNNTVYYNGHWLHFELPVPSTWNPGNNPANWWWSLRYRTNLANGSVAIDTVTLAVGLKGNPAHLLQG